MNNYRKPHDRPSLGQQDNEGASRNRYRLDNEAALAEEEFLLESEDNVERKARGDAVDEMKRWFLAQFEDPQNETPYDSEDGRYIYPWGGPFEARDVLGDEFGNRFNFDWIEEAIRQIERDGIVEWAPTSTGDYYEHPDPEDMDE